MKLKFAKMQGLGNDFMVIDAIHQDVRLNRKHIQRWSHRHLGVGFDQCLIIEQSQQDGIDFYYRIFNADGSEVEQCGNGARCVGRYLKDTGLSDNSTLRLATSNSVIEVENQSDGRVCVDMGEPLFAPRDIPLYVDEQQEAYIYQQPGLDLIFHALSMGNPHAIISVETLTDTPLESFAHGLDDSGLFPQGVNVSAMQVVSKDHIKVRVYERGVGETLACGTGACASAVSAILYHGLAPKLKVDLPGGRLHIEWQGSGHGVKMTGPAEWVFEGVISA